MTDQPDNVTELRPPTSPSSTTSSSTSAPTAAPTSAGRSKSLVEELTDADIVELLDDLFHILAAAADLADRIDSDRLLVVREQLEQLVGVVDDRTRSVYRRIFAEDAPPL